MTRSRLPARATGLAGTTLAPALLTLVLTACQPSADTQGGMPPRGPTEVNALTVQAADLPVALEFPARVHGSREVEIRPRVGGILLKRNYEEGSTVKAGQSLFAIDPVPFETAVARAEAELAAAEARLAQARREAERLRPLIAAQAASQQDLDNAQSNQSVAAAEAKAAQARLREARLNLAYTRVESPLTGIAARALPSEGSLLAGPETLLTTVTLVDPVHVLFGLSDTQQLQLQQDAEAGALRLPPKGRFKVALVLPDGSSYAGSGSTDFADVRVSDATGTAEVRAVVPNPKGVLRPGQFVRVRLEGALRPAAIEVPQRAVLEGPQGKFVYVIADGKAAARPVKPGEWRGDKVVIREGLQPGEQVIVDGVLKIGPGAPVQAAAPKQER